MEVVQLFATFTLDVADATATTLATPVLAVDLWRGRQ